MDNSTRVIRSKRALASPIANELVMFDAESGKYYGFNEVATAIWNHLEQEITIGELCEKLTDEFVVDPEQCRREVIEFVGKMRKRDLVEIR